MAWSSFAPSSLGHEPRDLEIKEMKGAGANPPPGGFHRAFQVVHHGVGSAPYASQATR